jgi:proline iminopeptidase
MPKRLPLFPEIQPFNRGRLKVSDLHEIYFEECGNPVGKPAVVLHGGPGGGISPFLKCAHDPTRYRIVVFDQRGCGHSTPHAELRDNTTWDLVSDIEKLRGHLGIDRWQVVGGSWGSTLALAYAQTHPERVTELIVRGIFTIRKQEIDWFYQFGASELFADAWQSFIEPIPPDERHDLLKAYHRRLVGTDEAEQIRCAVAWSQWEAATLSLLPDKRRLAEFGREHFALAFARIECHYFVNRGFFDWDDALLRGGHKLRSIPGAIVQGRYDVVTPMRTAFDLHLAWPEAEFTVVADAGHALVEPGITDAIVTATNRFAEYPA